MIYLKSISSIELVNVGSMLLRTLKTADGRKGDKFSCVATKEMAGLQLYCISCSRLS